MTQANYLIGANQSGTAYRTADNLGKEALLTCHKGSSRPSYAEQGMLWVDDSASPICLLKYFDGTSDLTIGTLDESGNLFTPSNAATINGSTNYAVATGSSNAYAITVTPARTTYTQGEVFYFKANFTNTGAVTLNVSALGAKNIYKRVTQPLVGGDIPVDAIVAVVYDGTNFQLLGLSGGSSGTGGISEVDTINADYSVDELTDAGKLFLLEGGDTVTLPAPATAGNGFQVSFRMMKFSDTTFVGDGGGNVFRIGSSTSSSYILDYGSELTISFICDGSLYYLTDSLFELSAFAADRTILGFSGVPGAIMPTVLNLNAVVTPAGLVTAGGTTQRRGMVLSIDGSDDTFFTESVDLSLRTFFYDDYSDYFQRSYTGSTGAGAAVTGGTLQGRPGILSLTTGTTSSGGSIVGQVGASRFIPATTRDMMFEVSINFPVLSTVAQEYIAFFGLNDKGTTISSTHPTNGAYFYYSRLANGNVWAIRTMNGGVQTETVLANAVAAGSWYKLRIMVKSDSARFYINGSLVGTITTNIPTALIGFSDWISKTAGTTSTVLFADYMMIAEEVSR
ncbi:MAG: LamG-like jellyroll fold domain-containing protein [Smithella sp.]